MGDLADVLCIKGIAPLRYLRLYVVDDSGSRWRTSTTTTAPLECFQHLATAFRHGACPAVTALDVRYGGELESIEAIQADMMESLQGRAKVTFTLL